MLLVCARCDKAYHTHCLTPPLNHTPDSNWICQVMPPTAPLPHTHTLSSSSVILASMLFSQSCRVCLRCGVRSSGHWANHPFLCASCDPALPCGVCGHTPDLYSLQDYVTCNCCYRYTVNRNILGELTTVFHHLFVAFSIFCPLRPKLCLI